VQIGVDAAGPSSFGRTNGDRFGQDILRLSTGIFYAQSVKANVFLFERKPTAADPWTKTTWVYDLRTNMHLVRSEDLADFVACFSPEDRSNRVESERFRKFTYEDVSTGDNANLDITWLRDESLDDAGSLPAPGVLAAEVVEEPEAAFAEFSEQAYSLRDAGTAQ
jgi:type I restriction enzyme M protein